MSSRIVVRIAESARQCRAKAWSWIYGLPRFIPLSRIRLSVGFVATVTLAIGSVLAEPWLQSALQPRLGTKSGVQSVQALFLGLGASLIGAAAIVSSLVLFAIQVNVERMPHGLFRRLSSDARLLLAFAGTFLLALAITGLSLMPGSECLAVFVLIAVWGVILTLALFLYVYRRALALVNPLRQLELLVVSAARSLKSVRRRANRLRPLVVMSDRDGPDGTDLELAAIFGMGGNWTAPAKQAVQHAISLHRTNAENGDYEVASAALRAVVAINEEYIEAKGRTFFGQVVLFENPLVSDEFINDTLEHLRQNGQIAIARSDEQQIEQTFRALLSCAQVYLRIDYANEHASKSHAHLAAGYLGSLVEAVLPHAKPDVVMEGLRDLGACAQTMLQDGGPNSIQTLVGKIGAIGSVGVVSEQYRPVTLAAVDQLSRLSFSLLGQETESVSFAAENIRLRVASIAKRMLQVPESPLARDHSRYLGPYYSGTEAASLSARLRDLVNAVLESDQPSSAQLIRNVADWANGMYETEKELLVEAIEKQSQFTFDMIEWIAHVTEVLVALSGAKACDERSKRRLHEAARWLVGVYSWMPSDESSVRFVEMFQPRERICVAALDAHGRGCEEVAGAAAEALLTWTLKVGSVEAGFGSMGAGMLGVAALALERGEEAIAALHAALSQRIDRRLISSSVRDRASEIRSAADELYPGAMTLSTVERLASRQDRVELERLLGEIADLLGAHVDSPHE